MTVIYYESDGDLHALAGRSIGIIGYTEVGRLFAQNLTNTGIPVVIGDDFSGGAQARADGMVTAMDYPSLVREADILMLTLPDEQVTQLYMSTVSPHLRKGQSLIFASAYTVAFGFIEPPPFVDVMMISPRTTSTVAGSPPPSYVAVWQDASRRAWDTVLAVARGTGALNGGGIEINIEQEAEISLFVQQAILPAFYHIITTAADLLMQQGYPTEAVISDLYLSGRFNDFLFKAMQSGIQDALGNESLTHQFGTLSRLDRFNDLKLERLMEVTLDDIRNGKFAREWSEEMNDGLPRFNKLRNQQNSRDLWELEKQTLDMLNDARSANSPYLDL